jgi:hypothetical protein
LLYDQQFNSKKKLFKGGGVKNILE